MSITLHSWRRKDPRTGRWHVLSWKMTDDDAKRWAEKELAEIEKVPGSEEVRTDVSGRGAVFFPAQSTEAIERRRQHQRELTPDRSIKDYPLPVRKRARQLVKARWDRQSPPKQPGR